MNEKVYYCFVPINAKQLLIQYINDFKEKTNRSVIITSAKYKSVDSGIFDAQGNAIFETQNLLGFCITADSLDLSNDKIELIESIGGKVFDNANTYLEYIKNL